MQRVIGRRRPTRTLVRRAIAPAILGAALASGLLSGTVPAAPRTERCARLEARMEQLRLKLRAGYTARQGRLWREQLRGAEAQHRVACR